MNSIAIIPARGGSKGIYRKNVVKIGNTPLIGFTIMAAKKSKYLNKIIVSTDDKEIMEISKEYGAETPFLRPDSISCDETRMIEVLKHSLIFLKESNPKIDAIVLLQPTSPLRNEKHIDEAIDLFFRSKASSVVSVVEVPHQYNPHSILLLNNKGELVCNSKKNFTRRQDKPKFYARNGPAILVIDPNTIINNDLYGSKSIPYFMNMDDSLDIDTISDLESFKRRIEK